MSNKIKSPNEKSHGFLIALISVLVIIAGVITYIVMTSSSSEVAHRDREAVNMDIAVGDNDITLQKNPKEDALEASLYEDYSCPHCGELAEQTDGDMKKKIESGDLILHIHPLNFLDRGNTSGNSTLAGAAALAIAQSGDAELYWNYRAMLMAEQSDIYQARWNDQKFADAAEGFDAPSDVVKAIKNGDQHDAMLDFASGNADYLNENTGKVSSPRVLVDGADMELSDWVAKLKN